MKLKSWVDPRTKRRKIGKISTNSLFAIEAIEKDAVVAIKAGKLVDGQFVRSHVALIRGSHVPIGKDLFLAPTTEEEWNDTLVGINHSCDPNSYIKGDIVFTALRNIEASEEITADYATIYADEMQTFACNCGSQNCRRQITSEDWKNTELQEKYKGKLSNYIQSLIDKQKAS